MPGDFNYTFDNSGNSRGQHVSVYFFWLKSLLAVNDSVKNISNLIHIKIKAQVEVY